MKPAENAENTAVPPRRVGVLVAVAAAALAADVISKIAVVASLESRPPIEFLGGLLTLRVLRNSGAAFNIGDGMTLVFTVIATGVVVAILRYARRLRSLPWAVTLGLLLGGALGNLADRILRSPGPFRGHVVDWIELPHWPVFNLADSAIVCGGALAVLLASRGLQVDGTVQRDGPTDESGPAPAGTRDERDDEPEAGRDGRTGDDAPGDVRAEPDRAAPSRGATAQHETPAVDHDGPAGGPVPGEQH